LASVAVLVDRPDVARHLGLPDDYQPTGFQLWVNTIGLPQTFELSLWARLADGWAIEFARLRGTASLPRSSFRPTLLPLSVTSLRRTGTTLLMGMLAEHPEIGVRRRYPFDARLGAHWMQVLAALSGPSGPFASSHPDQFQDERLAAVNSLNTLHQEDPTLPSWFAADAPEELVALCQRSLETAYLRIARLQGESPGRYFAEKNGPTYSTRLLTQLYDGAREIVLVRDFRDLICSMLAIDRKRRMRTFQRDDTVDAFIIRVVDEFRQLAAAWSERRHSALLVRYEDLITHPHMSLQRIAKYAGIDASPPVLEQMVAFRRVANQATLAHRTTNDGLLSVGRYRYDLDEHQIGLCHEVGGDLLPRLGYADEASANPSTEDLTPLRV
jgi:hypothetical protein